MSDGGIFAWKRQDIDAHRGPAGNFNGLQQSLPKPPKGTEWIQDPTTREWSLEKKEEITVAKLVYPDEEEKEFYEHYIQPSDTFAGICLRYKVTPTEIRRANFGLSGTNLNLFPNPLKIPNTGATVVEAAVQKKPQGGLTREQKMTRIMDACKNGGLSRSEAKCYLELNDWSLQAAIEDAHKDGF